MGRDDLVSNKDATGIEIRVQVRREIGRVVNFYFHTFQIKCYTEVSRLRDGWQ